MAADQPRRSYPLPPNEEERLRELHQLDLLAAERIEQIDRVCALARDLFKVPVALVTLVDRDRQCFLASAGIDLTETKREDAFCAVTILHDEPLVVANALDDPRFRDNIFVAGAPLNLRPGVNIGTLCLIDTKPRQFGGDDLAHLKALADMVVSEVRARRAARDLAAGQLRLSQAARLAKIGGYEFGLLSEKLVWDDEIYRIYGVDPGTPPSNDLIVACYDPEMRERSRQRLDALFTRGVPYDVELRGRRPNGEVFWVRAMAEPEIVNGKVARVFGAVQDITESKLAEARIHDLAYRDSLTGLPNRSSFIDSLNAYIEAARLKNSHVALVKLDIDHFREVNDALGHRTGDEVLKNVGMSLWEEFGHTGTVARIGSNEFAVVLPGVSADAAMSHTEAFVEHARPLSEDNSNLPVALSSGIAIFPGHGNDVETLIKNAKVALLEAKSRRRGKVVLFDRGMRETLESKLALLRRVAAGIENKEFVLFYQPIVGLRSGKVTALEALIRWNDPEFGLLTPGHFMAAFDDPDLAVELGDMVLDMAIAQMRRWLDEGVDFGNVAVNLTTAQFRLADLAETVLGKLARAKVSPQRLTLEVTENVYMAWGAEVVAATIRKLHAAGVEIALDDFGTGYASLAHLRQFPIDKLKIDKSFVQSTESAAIVDAVINMGMSLGMRVIAEGVEKKEQLSLLQLKGCDFVQGYLFAKPLEPERVASFIAGFGAFNERKKQAATA